MRQEFERIAPRLYRRTYETADGAESTLYYARFVCKLKGRRRMFALGGDLKKAKDDLKDFDYRNRHKEDFDAGKAKPEAKPAEAKPQPMTVREWAGHYLTREETKELRSYDRVRQLSVPLVRLLGDIPLVELTYDDLVDYAGTRKNEFVIRNKKPSKTVRVKPGTVANELSLLRAMLNAAFLCKDRKLKDKDGKRTKDLQYPGLKGFTVNVSFKGLLERSQRERVLEPHEQEALLGVYPTWLRRIAIVAQETCLSEGDIIRLTRPMIDRKVREIVPANGRKKTRVAQRAPLTDRVLQVLEEVEREKRREKIVDVNGPIFTREDGRRITKDMIAQAVQLACKRAGVADFVFHDYRHTALTEWAAQGRAVEVAMLAAGHKSVEMHNRYVNLKASQVAKAFGLENGNMDGRQNQSENPTKSVTA
jgi:integrase